jgi:hypothetical protein
MKIFMAGMIALLFLAPALRAELPVWFEGAAKVDLDKPVNFAVEGNVLIDVVKNLQARTNVFSFNLTHNFIFTLSSGTNLDLLLHFPGKGKASFYGIGGFRWTTGSGFGMFTGRIGPGIMQAQSKHVKFFLEAVMNFTSYSDYSHVGFAVSGGVRCR